MADATAWVCFGCGPTLTDEAGNCTECGHSAGTTQQLAELADMYSPLPGREGRRLHQRDEEERTMNRYRMINPPAIFEDFLKAHSEEDWDRLLLSLWSQAIESDQTLGIEYNAIVEAVALSAAERFKFLSVRQWMSILWITCARTTSEDPRLDDIDPESVIAACQKYLETPP